MNAVVSLEELELEPVTEQLKATKPGQPIVYHCGMSLRGCRDAKPVLAAYYRGEVTLSQRRVPGTSFFAYIVTKRREVKPPRVPYRLAEKVDRLLIAEAHDDA